MVRLLSHPAHLTALTMVGLWVCAAAWFAPYWTVLPGLLVFPIAVSLARQAFRDPNDHSYPSDPED